MVIMDYIPYGKQWIDDDDINEVVSVLKSDWITTGPKIKEFEDAICTYIGCEYCITVSRQVHLILQFNHWICQKEVRSLPHHLRLWRHPMLLSITA